MNHSGINPLALANIIAPANAVATSPVGLENANDNDALLPPIEESSSESQLTDDDKSAFNPFQTADQNDGEQTRADQRQQQLEQQQIRELAARQREVIAHEQAHAAVGGKYAGAPSYTYERGPDGVNYVVGGEVPISLPSGGDPKERIAAAERVREAALAPVDPSPQDRLVAAQATQLLLEARAELALQEVEEQAQAEQEEAVGDEPSEQAVALATPGDKLAAEQPSAAALSSENLSDQLITAESVRRNQGVGTVIDQRV